MDDDADDDTLSLAESTRYELRKRNVSREDDACKVPSKLNMGNMDSISFASFVWMALLRHCNSL